MMTLPSRMSLRRIPAPLHLPVRIAYAAGWEALIGTHTSQALQFVCEFAARLPVLDALDLYFQVVAVPEAMQEVVRTRTLTMLELESLPPLTDACRSCRGGSGFGPTWCWSTSGFGGGTASGPSSSRGWSGPARPRR